MVRGSTIWFLKYVDALSKCGDVSGPGLLLSMLPVRRLSLRKDGLARKQLNPVAALHPQLARPNKVMAAQNHLSIKQEEAMRTEGLGPRHWHLEHSHMTFQLPTSELTGIISVQPTGKDFPLFPENWCQAALASVHSKWADFILI